MLVLHKEQLFNINNLNRLGTMRFDFYDGKLSNQWNPTELLIESNKSNNIDLKILQKELNYLLFDLLNSFEKVLEYTNGNRVGYDNETYLYARTELFDYVVKLIPVLDCYSYIYTYNK